MPESIRLPHKPDTPLSYRLVPGQGSFSTTHLVVFLNGLILPQTGWQATIDDLRRRWDDDDSPRNDNYPALLTYDRYSQGESGRDPADEQHGGTHDILEVVRDLHELVQEIWDIIAPTPTSTPTRREGGTWRDQPQKQRRDETGQEEYSSGEGSTRRQGERRDPPPPPNLIFIGNSIGCVIARLYASTYPGVAEGFLLLDSNMANSDMVSVFPDPDAPDFDPKCLPDDVTVDDLRRTRERYAAAFHPSVPNPEHLDRRNIAELLPHADKPRLRGPPPPPQNGDGDDDGAKGPWITVVGHDWETFADEGLRGSMNVPKSLTNAFMNPAWGRYNEGLVRLTEEDRARGPVIAKRCGHFIQRDDPVLVAELIDDLLRRVETGAAAYPSRL
ncbi:hypothetical protein AAE478_000574 [Parahypoxylon ruwenzoriense]